MIRAFFDVLPQALTLVLVAGGIWLTDWVIRWDSRRLDDHSSCRADTRGPLRVVSAAGRVPHPTRTRPASSPDGDAA